MKTILCAVVLYYVLVLNALSNDHWWIRRIFIRTYILLI